MTAKQKTLLTLDALGVITSVMILLTRLRTIRTAR